MIKKLPQGISNYEELVNDGYCYVDKTKYIEKLENFSNKRIMFLRPRKFGKTLFTSVLECYYDILKKDKFEKLFVETGTYIGKNPTSLKNSYHILKFNFSGIDTSSVEATIRGFKREVSSSINVFVKRYNIDFYVNDAQEAEDILDNLFKAFALQKNDEKIYVIIDEYDHFANELLGFHTEHFKNLVSRDGKVRKWYEILKKGTETVVDRIFITGVAPITLDSLTSGFNIVTDITRDFRFNEMFGFTWKELIKLINTQDLSKEDKKLLLPLMKENYDGYKFSLKGAYQMYNSNMCLYLLSYYSSTKMLPESLVDVNIASDYSKLSKMLELCSGNEKVNILEKTVSGETITAQIIEKFNPATTFAEQELISMLFYLGYLTIVGESFGKAELKIPNHVMKELYADYFLAIVKKDLDIHVLESENYEMTKELACDGKIDKMIEILKKYLNNLSNRDLEKFDEKYVKILFYSIAMNTLKTAYWVKSEYEVQRKYPDLLLIPKEREKGYYTIMIEFKYLKKEKANLLEEKQNEARNQIVEYSNLNEIKNIDKIEKYAVVAVADEVYIYN